MSKVEIQVAYTGEAVSAGMMDVADLAPALLSLSDLCREANQVLNQDRAYVSVNIRSNFTRGSFEINLELILHALGQIYSALGELKKAEEMAELLGLIGGDGLLSFLRWLKGHSPTNVTKLENGMVKVDLSGTNIQSSSITINPTVYSLYCAHGVRRAFNGVVKPLDRDGIEKFEIRKGKRTISSISKDERPAVIVPMADGDIVHQGDHVAVFQVVRASFKERFKWTLTDGYQNFNVAVHDNEFVKKVEDGALAFRRGDSLKVRVQTTTRKTDKGMVTEYKILNVMDVLREPAQLPLLEDIKSDDRRTKKKKK